VITKAPNVSPITVWCHRGNLRRKLGPPPLIATVRGVGFVLQR